MHEVGNIHIFEDHAFQTFMVRVSGAVLAFGACLGIALFAVLPAVKPQRFAPLAVWDRVSAMLFASSSALDVALSGLGWFVVLLVGTTVALTVHELVHGLFFKLFAPAASRVTFGANWGMGMLYACAEGIVYRRGAYLVIILAPTVAVSLLIVITTALSGWYVCGFIVFVLHFSGCVGDWGYVRAIVGDARISHCEDTDWGVRFLAEGAEGADFQGDSGRDAVGEGEIEDE